MRLINVETLKLEYFASAESAPRYAILSHTWGPDEEELSFDDLRNGRVNKAGRGSVKLHGCVAQAAREGITHVWIDTCCINKTDSVELGEAINSMFAWYERAQICYVYLSEASSGDYLRNPPADLPSTSWFRRGWTLQEILAPKNLRFYDAEWNSLGDMRVLASAISSITGIPLQFMARYEPLGNASIAQRMSWASNRVTKKGEDIAYCLLGVFGVSMTMNYGEGRSKAFERLQREIMEANPDDSILAWGFVQSADVESGPTLSRGVLAESPSDFSDCGQIVARKQEGDHAGRPTFTPGYVRVGVDIQEHNEETMGLLKCGPSHDPQAVIGIPMCSTAEDYYIRPRGYCCKTLHMDSPRKTQIVRISTAREHPTATVSSGVQYQFHLDLFPAGLQLIEACPAGCWDGHSPTITVNTPAPNEDGLWFLAKLGSLGPSNQSQGLVVLVELTENWEDQPPQIRCHVMESTRSTEVEDLSRQLLYLKREAWRQRVRTGTGAGSFLRVNVERIGDGRLPLFAVSFAAEDDDGGAESEPDIASELERVRLRLELLDVLLEGEEVEPLPLDRRISEQKEDTVILRERLANIDQQIRALHCEREAVVAKLQRKERELGQLEASSTDIHRKWKWLSDRRSQLQRALDKGKGEGSWFHDTIQMLADAGRTHVSHLSKAMACEESGDPKTSDQVASRQPGRALRCATALKALLAAMGDDFYSKSRDGDLIEWAARNRHGKLVQLLFDAEAGPTAPRRRATTIWDAAADGNTAAVQLWLDKGGVGPDSRDRGGRTPLSWAAEKGHKHVVKLLLEKQAGVDTRDNLGRTPLIYADGTGHDAVIQLLLKNGADTGRTMSPRKSRASLQVPKVYSVAFSPDSKTFASGSKYEIKLWDTTTGKSKRTLTGHTGRVKAIAFSHDSKWLASASEDKTIRVWRRTTGKVQFVLDSGHDYGVHSVAFSADSALIASGSLDNFTGIWDTATGKLLHKLGKSSFSSGVKSVAFSRDSKIVAAGTSESDMIKIWDAQNGELRRTLKKHSNSVYAVAFAPSADLMASGSYDDTALIWDTSTWEVLHRLAGHPGGVYSVAFSHDSKLLACACGHNGEIQLWNVASGERVDTLRHNSSKIYSVAFSHDSNILASASSDDTVKIWAVAKVGTGDLSSEDLQIGYYRGTIWKAGKDDGSGGAE